jgi:hypothetical protein
MANVKNLKKRHKPRFRWYHWSLLVWNLPQENQQQKTNDQIDEAIDVLITKVNAKRWKQKKAAHFKTN